jgi:SAM-dependent methyltransferase
VSSGFFRSLVREAARRYPPKDRYARHFASGKLGRDPVFRHLLEHGLLAGEPCILDIGCGQGNLAALLAAARARHASGDWPADWPAPPAPREFRGIDLLARDVARAQSALGAQARFTCGDMREADFGEADAIVILDVLHYVDRDAQDDVLRRVRGALGAGGLLLLRIGAKSGSLRFRYTEWVDRIVMRLRGHRLTRLHGRATDEWARALEALGFRVEARPMSAGTGFANVLLVARLAGPCASRGELAA